MTFEAEDERGEWDLERLIASMPEDTEIAISRHPSGTIQLRRITTPLLPELRTDALLERVVAQRSGGDYETYTITAHEREAIASDTRVWTPEGAEPGPRSYSLIPAFRWLLLGKV